MCSLFTELMYTIPDSILSLTLRWIMKLLCCHDWNLTWKSSKQSIICCNLYCTEKSILHYFSTGLTEVKTHWWNSVNILNKSCFYFLTHTNPSNFGRILSLFILFHRSTVCDYIPLLFDHFLLFLIPLISILGAKKAEVPRLEWIKLHFVPWFS